MRERKDLELIAIVANDLPETLIGDPTRLRQILVNLVGNAIKFTEQGEVVVRFDRRPEIDAATAHAVATTTGSATCLLQVAVTDTGCGITPHERERLFDAFTQIDASTTRMQPSVRPI